MHNRFFHRDRVKQVSGEKYCATLRKIKFFNCVKVVGWVCFDFPTSGKNIFRSLASGKNNVALFELEICILFTLFI